MRCVSVGIFLNKVNLKQISTQQRDSIINLSGVMTGALFLISAIGSYRVFLVYAGYCLLKAMKIEKKYIFIFFPAFMVSIYLDATNGPIFMQNANPYNYPIVLAVFVAVDLLIHILFEKMVSGLTEGQYFIECPSCHFNNTQLVETCSNCSYKKGEPVGPSTRHVSASAKGDKIPNGLIPLLGLVIDEDILFHKRLTSYSQQLKNGGRIVRKHFVITTSNVIIVDYLIYLVRFPKSWRERDVIPLSEINVVEGKMKTFMKDICPFLIIRTKNSDIYEIVISTMDDYIAQIAEIASIIKKVNPQVEIKIELYETSLNRLAKRFFPGRFSSRK